MLLLLLFVVVLFHSPLDILDGVRQIQALHPTQRLPRERGGHPGPRRTRGVDAPSHDRGGLLSYERHSSSSSSFCFLFSPPSSSVSPFYWSGETNSSKVFHSRPLPPFFLLSETDVTGGVCSAALHTHVCFSAGTQHTLCALFIPPLPADFYLYPTRNNNMSLLRSGFR